MSPPAADAPQGRPTATTKERAAKARDNAVVLQLTRTKMCAFYLKGRCSSTKCRFAHSMDELRAPPNLQKTKLCKAFLHGSCAEGDQCVFAHNERDLRVTEGIYKTQICNFYERGFCKKGSRCNHAHGAAELRPPAKGPIGQAPVKSRSRLPLDDLIEKEMDDSPTSTAVVASFAFSPVPPLPPSPMWGGFDIAGAFPPAGAVSPMDLTPQRLLDPLDVLMSPHAQDALAPPGVFDQAADPAVVDLSHRLATLDLVVRELTADVKVFCGSGEKERKVEAKESRLREKKKEIWTI